MYRAIAPDALQSVWPEVRPMLDAALRKVPANWIPEDVYAECRQAKAYLWLGEGSLLVLSPTKEEFTGIPLLHIWVAFNADDDFDAGLNWVREHAAAHGFKSVTFDSPRKGWAKRFRTDYTRYRIDP